MIQKLSEEDDEDKEEEQNANKLSLKERIRMYVEISGIAEIGRRYLVMNAFDGALTVLGVIIGAIVAGLESPKLLIGTGIGASIAMGVSGLVGAYITERAERRHKMQELEESMMFKIKDTIYEEASTFATIVVAIIDGLAPAAAALIAIIPFFLVEWGILTLEFAYTISLGLTFGVLFLLGIFLGKVSRENMILYGIIMIAAGLLTALITVYVTGGTVL